MPYPFSINGVFDYRSAGEPSAAAAADRIEHVLGELGALDIERFENTITFQGPPLSTAGKTNPLVIVADGEIDVSSPTSAGAVGRVRYKIRTTRGLGILATMSVLVDLGAQFSSGAHVPPLVFTGLLAVVWAIQYLVAWIRVPLVLMRAADGELARRDTAMPQRQP